MIRADKEKDDLELFYDEFFRLPGPKLDMSTTSVEKHPQRIQVFI